VVVGDGAGVVVVLFTDIVQSTKLFGRLGDDDAEKLRRDHFSLLRELVEESGGREVKSLGDGLMVAFVSPVEALRCAVTMQERVAEHNRKASEPVEIRIGLHAGEPVADGTDLHGTSVVVARRLCDRAGPGQILTSELVAELIGSRGGFRLRRMGRLALKGVRQPVAAVAVDWAPADFGHRPVRRSGTGRPRPPKPIRSRGPSFVGRTDELAILEEELRRAATGDVRCVLLVGEPGLGKSRLTAEFLARAHEDGLVLSARAYPLGATASFGLWAEALDGHLRGLGADEIVTLCGGFLDDVAGLLRSAATVRGSAPDREPSRLRLMESLAVLLSNLAAQEPVVVVLDDVHLADSSSWEALRYLTHNLSDARLLILAIARPVELADHPVGPGVVFGLEQDDLLRRLPVGTLDAASLGELAATVSGAPATVALVDWLAERSRGNALYAVGLLQALIDEGADLGAPALRRIPEGLADRVNERLKSLDEPSRSTLETLAVMGRRVGMTELAAVTSRPRDRLDAILDGLLRLRLILEEERGRELVYEIAHPLIQEVIYQGIRGARRRALHRTAGRALLDGGFPGEAAPHFVRSADPGDAEAIEALLEALRQAEEREADREALEILGGLVDVLPAGDPRWADVAATVSWDADWLVDHRADNLAVGLRAMQEISAVLARSDDPIARATIRLRLAAFLCWGTGQLVEADRACREAVTLFEEIGEEPRALLARNELAWIAGIGGSLGTMEDEARRVVEAAQRRANRFAEMQAWTTLGNALMFRGRFSSAEAALQASLEIAIQDGKLYEQMRVLSVLAISYSYEGRLDAAFDAISQAKTANPAVPPTWEPFAHWMKGDYPATLVAVREAMAWKPIGASLRRGVLLALAALAAAEVDDLGQAARYAADAVSIYGDQTFMFFGSYATYSDALVAWREGRTADAAQALATIASRLTDREGLPFATPLLLDLSELAVDLGDVGLAGEAATSLASIAEAVDRDLHRGCAALAAANGARTVDDPTAATSARSAVETFSDLGYPVLLGRAFFVLGQALSRSDRPAAIEALERAAGLFQGIGATWRRDRALDALRSLPGKGRRVAGALLGPASLTAREREVATLASQGLTAREIADRLYIGERTVEAHLASVYAKLGIRSKVDLVRRAADLSG
jgi:class 3 adenylate cyclase/DNA-binding CsgD family transcriptional regulator